MKSHIIVLLAVCIFNLAKAQENYQPGFIIKYSKDTVTGFIDYRNWKRNPDQIHFKENADAAVFIYGPNQIKGFSVADEYYESATVEIEVSPERMHELTVDPEFQLEQQKAFLQNLVYGSKSLYYLVNKKGKDNFYIKNGDQLELLLYKQYVNANYSRQVIVNSKFIGQLLNYLNYCDELKVKLSSTKYLQKDFEKLFTAYYTCTQTKPIFQKKRERVTTQFGVMGGITLSSLIMGKNNKLAVSKAEYDNSLSLTAGIYLTFVLPRSQGRFAIQNELLLTNYNINGHYLEYKNDNYNTKNTYTFRASHLKLNTLARMKIPTRNFDFCLEAGISNAFAVSIAADQTQVVTFYAPPVTKKSEVLDTRIYEQGLVAGFGANYKKFFATVRFERSNGFSKEESLKTAFNRVYLMIGYRISK